MFCANSKGKPSAIDNKKFKDTTIKKVNTRRALVKNGNYNYISEELCRKVDKEIEMGKIFYFDTPFGTVTIQKKSKDELFVYGGQTSSYGAIVDNLKKFNHYDLNTVSKLYEYLCLLKNSSEEFKLVDSKKTKASNEGATLAYLCAILILAEPYRLRDDGKFVRGELRKIHDDFMKEIQSPIKKAWGSRKHNVTSEMPLSQKRGKQKVLSILNDANNPELEETKKYIESLDPYVSDDES